VFVAEVKKKDEEMDGWMLGGSSSRLELVSAG
jgi:hypothetical protein